MEIKIARTAGFCMGVRRAVSIALAAAQNSPPPVAVLGELVHNRSVSTYLAQKNIATITDQPPNSGTVIIRAHGIAPQEESTLRDCGLPIIDATCPLVKKSQQLVENWTAKNKSLIIVGDRAHAEIQGLITRANAGIILSSLAEAENFPPLANAVVLAQTTFSPELYAVITAALQRRMPDLIIEQTICDATTARQREVREMAGECDAIVIVGSEHSANTARLAETANFAGVKKVLRIETADELSATDFVGAKIVGVSAGASAPDWEIEKVIALLRRF